MYIAITGEKRKVSQLQGPRIEEVSNKVNGEGNQIE
jgi:hypothetical protein